MVQGILCNHSALDKSGSFDAIKKFKIGTIAKKPSLCSFVSRVKEFGNPLNFPE
jgi:hypothetical protein